MSSLDVRAIDSKELKSASFPKARHEFRVHIAESAFDRAVARGDADTTREIGGVLIGELLRDEAGPFLRVEATIDALHADEKGAELTFTHATWEHINKEMDSKHAGKKIVGWYHTHPGFGIFLSDRDQFIQRSFFNLPFQVALVYDPKSREHGVFGWRDNEAWRLRRYWVGEREHQWDGSRPAPVTMSQEMRSLGDASVSGLGSKGGKGGGKAAGGKDAPAEAVRPVRDPDGGGPDWTSVLLIGAFGVLVAGGVGFWLGGRSANDVVRDVQNELRAAHDEGRRAAFAALNGQVLGILRATLGDEAMRRPAQQIVSDLDEAAKALAPPPGASPDAKVADALGRIRGARAEAQRMRDERVAAHVMLEQLEQEARRGGPPVNTAELAREMAYQRNGLGGLYADLAVEAARAGDAKRARRLLTAAATLDPGNYAAYQQQLSTIDKDAQLPPPRPALGAPHDERAPGPATTAPAPAPGGRTP